MSVGLSDHVIDRIAAFGAVIGLTTSAMLWRENRYPFSMVADFLAGLILAGIFLRRRTLASQHRMTVISLGGLVVGMTAIFQTPMYANGYLILGTAMVLSFTNWDGWRAWLLPLASVTGVLVLAIAVGAGAIGIERSAPLDPNDTTIWIVTLMTIALLAVCIGGAIGDLKRRLLHKVDNLEEVNRRLFLAAYTDSTTGLGNRKRLVEAVDADLAQDRPGCLLLMELTQFARFGTLHGHGRGDEVLLRFARILSHLADGRFVVASLPAVQFGVWMPGLGADDACRFFDAFVEGLSKEVDLRMGLGVAAGLAVSPRHGASLHELDRHASIALTQARAGHDGPRCLVFSADMARAAEAADRIKQAVRRALDAGDFYPVYQTKVSSRTGRVCGAEGLARMRVPGPGPAPGPAEFIPVIHAEGWMTEFGTLMLEAIVRDVPRLIERYGAGIKVSANVSPPLFVSPDFLPILRGCLQACGVAPANIVIEITEEVFASNLEDIIAVTNEIRRLGAEVSLDDFGAGFSSLSYLREVQFDEIKIDRSFIRSIDHDARSKVLLAAITDLGTTLGSRLVAEGVETREQLEGVQRAGCDIVQGFFYSRPLPLAQLARQPEPAA